MIVKMAIHSTIPVIFKAGIISIVHFLGSSAIPFAKTNPPKMIRNKLMNNPIIANVNFVLLFIYLILNEIEENQRSIKWLLEDYVGILDQEKNKT